jgi:hypothetical protein
MSRDASAADLAEATRAAGVSHERVLEAISATPRAVELRGALGGLGGLVEDQRSHTDPCLEMWPCRTVRSEPRTAGVSPAQLASLRALGNRVMSPISATIISAVNWPTPGKVVSTLTRGSAVARRRTSASSRPVSGAGAPGTARQSVTISRDTAGRSSSASQPRPGPVQ